VKPFPALVDYSLKAGVPPRRRAALLLPCAAAILFGALSRGLGGDASHHFGRVAALGLFALVLPVTTLVVGDAVLGAEIRRGAFTFTWMSPIPPWRIVVARWMGGTAFAAGSIALSFAIAALVAGTPDSVGPVALAGAFGAAAYVAVFMAIGTIAQRAAVWSLAFVFLVERLLGVALSGVAQLSPAWESRMAFVGMAEVGQSLHRDGLPEGWSAIVRLVLLTATALAIASWRLPNSRMAGSSD
jgi:ABC-type transport system involved in multi-copper enzyme maturation permease subunit